MMPGEAFYKGLTLGEQVRKFLDHHYDPKTRHISGYEAQMLDQARARIEQTLEIAKREATQELLSVYEASLQVYETLIAGETRVVAVNSFATWHLKDPIAVLVETGLMELARDPSPSDVQAALAALITSSDTGTAVEEMYASLAKDRRLVERELDPTTLAVLNRVLYMPTVVAENSWADVAPLLDHLSKAKSKGAPVVMFAGTMVASSNVTVAFLAGGSVIVLQLLQDLAQGMSPGLRGLGEKLTGSWRLPEPKGVSSPNTAAVPPTQRPLQLPPG
jgi:hypothetical protein